MTNLPWTGASGMILATIVIIGVFCIWRIGKELKSGFPLKDERTQRISWKAAYYAFHLGSYFMVALMLLNFLNRQFRGADLLDGWYAIIISIVAQSLMYLGLCIYIERRDGFQ